MVIVLNEREKARVLADESSGVEQPPSYVAALNESGSSSRRLRILRTSDPSKDLPPPPPTLHVVEAEDSETLNDSVPSLRVPIFPISPSQSEDGPGHTPETPLTPPSSSSQSSSSYLGVHHLRASSSSSSLRSVTQNKQRTNFVSKSCVNGLLRGSYVIDPSLHIPESLLPPLVYGETRRRNVALHCANGGLNVELWLVGGGGAGDGDVGSPGVEGGGGPRTRADVSAVGANGSAKLRLHSDEGVPARIEFTIHNGSGKLWLPRSFHGPIRATTALGWLVFSSQLQPSLHSFGGEIMGPKHYFIGSLAEFSDVTKSGRQWEGWELEVNVRNARLKVAWVDEAEVEAESEVEEGGEGGKKAKEKENKKVKPTKETKKERKAREERGKAEMEAKVEAERKALRERLMREEMEKREREALAKQFEQERKELMKANKSGIVGKFFKSSTSSSSGSST